MKFLLIIPLLALSVISVPALATSSGITLSGRILEPDDVTPVSGSTQFTIQIRTPDSSCVLYQEQQSQDLTGTDGTFSLTINDGSGVRQDSTGLTISQVFANRGTFTFPSGGCSATSYTPNVTDGRILSVTFQSTSMAASEAIPNQAINFAPSAIEAQQVSGFPATSLLRFANSDGTLVNTTPLNNSEYASLTALVDGTSTVYAKPGDAINGTSIYTTAATSGIASSTVGDMWLDTSGGVGSDVLKINTDSGVKAIPLTTAGSFISSITAGTGIAVTTTGSNSTVSLAPGGVTGTELANNAVTDLKLSPSINIATTGSVSANSITSRSLAVANTSGSSSVTLYAPASFTSYSLTLPYNRGLSGQVLTSDGSGNLNWTSSALGNLNSGQIFVGSATNTPLAVSVSGDETLTALGVATVTGLRGTPVDTTTPLDSQVLSYNGALAKWSPQYFSIGSLRTSTGATQFANASCTSAQTLTWSSLIDAFNCTPIAIDAAAIASGTIAAARLPASVTSWTASSSILYPTSATLVGIGTTAPVYPLDVNGSVRANVNSSVAYSPTSSSLAAPGTPALNISNSYPINGAGSYETFQAYNGSVTQQSVYIGATSVSSGYTPALVIGQRTGATAYNERLRIDPLGNIGIGTTAPANALDVAGFIRSSSGGFKFPDGTTQTTAAGGGGNALSALTAATVTNTIDNLNFAQMWNWSTATTQTVHVMNANALTTGGVLSIATSNNSLNSTNGLLNIANTGTSTSGMVARIQSNSTAGSGLSVLASGNVGIGTTAPAAALDINGNANVSGSLNLSVGKVTSAGYSILTISPAAGSQNTFVGSNSGTALTGNGIVALGSGALSSTTSSDNSSSTAIGTNALGHSTGNSNTGVGFNSLYSATGYANVALGYGAGTNLSAGNGNTFLGNGTGAMMTSGVNNVLIGNQAGPFLTNGSSNIIIGSSAAASFTNGTGNIVIGSNAPLPSTANNTMSLGGAIYATGLGGTTMVGIGTISPQGALDINSTVNGVILPRMTKSQRNAIAGAIAGTAIFQTDNSPGLRVYNGSNWMKYSETSD